MQDEEPIERTPAQFFFEVGFGAAYAKALIDNDMKPPFEYSDAVVERAWEMAGEIHEDHEEFDRYLAAADRLEALARPVVGVEQRDTEAKAWEWIDKTYSDAHNDAVDRAYAADEMVDAFHAGVEQSLAALAASPLPVVGDREAIARDISRLAGCQVGSERTRKIVDYILSLSAPVVGGFQDRVAPWMQECFGPLISADKLERNDRFIEESLELVQSLGYSADRAHALVDYVFGRAIGEPTQEVGGVMVTLAALCLAADLDMHDAGEVELARINRPEIIAKIRAKQAAKPTGSALPIDPHTMDRAGMMQEVEQIAENANCSE